MNTSALDRRKRRCRRLPLVALVALGILCGNQASAEPFEIVVIVNIDNSVADITLPQLRRIMRLDRRRWADGSPIELILPSLGSPAMEALIERVFEVGSAAEVAQFYMSAIYEQKVAASPPTASSQSAVAIVAQSKGALALVPITAAVNIKGVRVISVEGL